MQVILNKLYKYSIFTRVLISPQPDLEGNRLMFLSEWRKFPSALCFAGKNLMTARISILLKLRASLTCFRACCLPGRAKDLSLPQYICVYFQNYRFNCSYVFVYSLSRTCSRHTHLMKLSAESWGCVFLQLVTKFWEKSLQSPSGYVCPENGGSRMLRYDMSSCCYPTLRHVPQHITVSNTLCEHIQTRMCN